ncbi:hypothetical protein [Chitinophaga sp. 22620]|uniref:hypothetical protein n=1 Tax=Chitinophaga sp. 22620 TaxID=3453952 RepID=UPI003F8554D6
MTWKNSPQAPDPPTPNILAALSVIKSCNRAAGHFRAGRLQLNVFIKPSDTLTFKQVEAPLPFLKGNVDFFPLTRAVKIDTFEGFTRNHCSV